MTELFVINRYEEDNELHDKNENTKLEVLQRKIEQRKLAKQIVPEQDNTKQADEEEIISNEICTEKISKKPKRKKEKRLVEEPLPEVNDSDIVDAVQDEADVNDGQPVAAESAVPSHEYKVLGVNEFEKKSKVKRVLPSWLCNPVSFPISLQDLTTKISKLKWLDPTVKKILDSDGITHLFPVQEAVIPFILEAHSKPAPFWPNDICVSAPTGSGKTLTFVLPILQLLRNPVGHHIRALIVLPVQELANQVAKVFRKYAEGSGLKVASATGLVPLSQEQSQIVRHSETAGWQTVVDILVCTAGRLVEHLHNTEGFSLKNLRFLVIDEADRIMDNIQNDWLYHLDKHIKLDSRIMTGKAPLLTVQSLYSAKRPPQKLLFSATLSQDPEKLDQWGLFQPRLFSCTLEYEEDGSSDAIRKYATPKELSEYTVLTDIENKPLSMFSLITEGKWDRILCFANASQSAHRLALLLGYISEGKLKVAELSSALNRALRDAVLKKFQNGEINVLISTDALARGIDIPNCDYVISYDPPKNVKTYIHRVGRTGRAGRSGTAITMITHNQLPAFKDTIYAAGKPSLPEMDIPTHIMDHFYTQYEYALQKTKSHIREDVRNTVMKIKALKRGRKGKLEKLQKDFNAKKKKIDIELTNE